jgi:hypothetical protein
VVLRQVLENRRQSVAAERRSIVAIDDDPPVDGQGWAP